MAPRTTHGATILSAPLCMVWRSMWRRCERPDVESYKYYGARGIRVCEEWREHPDVFVRWALANGYRKGLSIDRIDNDGHYSPENCRWVDAKTQARNKRKNRYIEFRGECCTMAEWAERVGISAQIIAVRLDRCGWSVEKALTTTPKKEVLPRAPYKLRRRDECAPTPPC